MVKTLNTALLVCLFLPPVSLAEKKQTKANSTKIVFAGGCFWCMEPPFDKLPGVKKTISGYMGGAVKNPTYRAVSSGTTGHTEVVLVEYDPAKVTFKKLLDTFWRNINPTDAGGQFVDRGSQYRSEIFYFTDEQRKAAEASKAELEKSKKFSKPIVTPITKAAEFYPAEDYHQDYYKKSSVRYKYYRYRSGRDQYLDKVWGKDRK